MTEFPAWGVSVGISWGSSSKYLHTQDAARTRAGQGKRSFLCKKTKLANVQKGEGEEHKPTALSISSEKVLRVNTTSQRRSLRSMLYRGYSMYVIGIWDRLNAKAKCQTWAHFSKKSIVKTRVRSIVVVSGEEESPRLWSRRHSYFCHICESLYVGASGCKCIICTMHFLSLLHNSGWEKKSYKQIVPILS